MNQCDSKQQQKKNKQAKSPTKKEQTKQTGTVKEAKNHFGDSGDGWNKGLEIVFESAEQRAHKQKDTDT